MRFTLGLVILSSLACSGLVDTGEGKQDDEADTGDGPPTLDLLLVIDTSSSMSEEGVALALGLDGVVGALAGTDWRIGITTASADPGGGASSGVDPGEAGSLVGAVVGSSDVDAVETLRAELLCDTIYWKESELARDPAYEPADGGCPVPTAVSREYLDCVCGGETWNTDEGSGNEEGLEVIYAALCRADGDQPDACWDAAGALTTADAGSNADLWRDGAPAAVLLLSDEGDNSRRASAGDADPSAYLELYAATGRNLALYVLGPAYHYGDGTCLSGAMPWGVERYQGAAEGTGGHYADLTAVDEDCTPADVAAEMTGLLAAVGA